LASTGVGLAGDAEQHHDTERCGVRDRSAYPLLGRAPVLTGDDEFTLAVLVLSDVNTPCISRKGRYGSGSRLPLRLSPGSGLQWSTYTDLNPARSSRGGFVLASTGGSILEKG